MTEEEREVERMIAESMGVPMLFIGGKYIGICTAMPIIVTKEELGVYECCEKQTPKKCPICRMSDAVNKETRQ